MISVRSVRAELIYINPQYVYCVFKHKILLNQIYEQLRKKIN